MATHIFHTIVTSARLFMKKASWGSLFQCLIRLVNLLVSQNLVVLVLGFVPGQRWRLGARQVRTVMAVQ